MKKKTITLYEYSELSPKGKDKAYSDYIANSFDDYGLQVHLDSLIEYLLKKHNIKVLRDLKGYKAKYAKVYYSLGHCQGDGVMFEGVFKWKKWEVTVKHEGHYYHKYSKNITMTCDNDEPNEKEIEAFDKVYKQICDVLEKEGYTYIDDVTSVAYFEEECTANEWTFRENGEMEIADDESDDRLIEVQYYSSSQLPAIGKVVEKDGKKYEVVKNEIRNVCTMEIIN